MEVLIPLIQKGSISRATKAVKNMIEDLQNRNNLIKNGGQISDRVEHSLRVSF